MSRFTLALTAVLLCPQIGLAAPFEILNVEGVTDSETNANYYGSQSDASVEVSSPSAVNLNFGSLGVTQLSFIWTAPDGQQINVDTPTGYPLNYLDVRYFLGNSDTSSGAFTDGAPTVTFEGLIGTAPSAPDAFIHLSGSGGNQVSARAQFNLSPGTSFAFQKITLTTLVPDDFDVDFTGIAQDWRITGTVAQFELRAPGLFASVEESNPQWVYLSDIGGPAVPEPTSMALLLMGGAGLVGYGWRKRQQA